MSKIVNIPDLGQVRLIRRRGAKSIRLSLHGSGEIHVSLPSWVPYRAGLQFLESKKDWILSKRTTPQLLESGQLIGKTHRLHIMPDPETKSVRSRINSTAINVKIPVSMSPNDPTVQTDVKKAAIRALRQESEELLPGQLKVLADKFGYSYRSVSVKRLKARWGSCSHQQDIVLNIFLMTLPWNLIDYVLVHELVHTKHQHHGAEFWEEFTSKMPDAKQRRRALKQYSPYF